MESQPQNPELRINPENFHPCISYVKINKHFEDKIVNVFLPTSFNISFGSSKEPSN